MPSSYSNTSWTPGLPTAADANKYFYLPALGYSILGQQSQVGSYGGYWSSSASAGSSNNQANSINFSNGYMTMGGAMGRHFGFRAQPFSDFGDN